MLRGLIRRHDYSDKSTIGVLFLDGVFFSYTLEDVVRLARDPVTGDVFGKKIPGHTAIPSGIYPMRVSWSPRFQRDMVEVLDVPLFTGIRVHSGNDEDDTEGCPLVARKAGRDWIGTESVALSSRLTELVKEAGAAELVVQDMEPVRTKLWKDRT